MKNFKRNLCSVLTLGITIGLSSLALTIAAVALLPNTGYAQKVPRKGGTMVMVVQPEPPALSSYVSTSGPVGQVATKVYEGLLEYDFNLQPIPSLAKSWILSKDGKTITFKLQEGVKWHDGKPFTSADVQFSFMEVLKKLHPRGINTLRDLDAVETPDPHTAVFKLKNPAPYLMMALSGFDSPIVPRHLFEGTDIQNNPYANKPVGTGPFKFVEWQRGQYMRFDRNPQYWKPDRPHLDRIVVRFIADAGTRSAAMQRGEVHFAAFNAIPNVDLDRLMKLPNIEVTTNGYQMMSPIIHLDFNTSRKPFDDVRVRQAVAYAIDRKFVIDNIWFGYGKIATGPISSNFKVTGIYTSDVKNYNVKNGVEIANKILDEAGYKKDASGLRFEIVHDITPYGEEWRRTGEYVQQALAQIGIKATLRYEDVPTWLRRIYTNYDYQLTSNWVTNLADPAIGVHRLYASWTINPGTVFVNATGWFSPRTDELMRQAALETDPNKRATIYHEFQKLLVEASPLVWICELEFVTVRDTKCKDVIVSPLGVYASFDQAWLDQ